MIFNINSTHGHTGSLLVYIICVEIDMPRKANLTTWWSKEEQNDTECFSVKTITDDYWSIENKLVILLCTLELKFIIGFMVHRWTFIVGLKEEEGVRVLDRTKWKKNIPYHSGDPRWWEKSEEKKMSFHWGQLINRSALFHCRHVDGRILTMKVDEGSVAEEDVSNL